MSDIKELLHQAVAGQPTTSIARESAIAAGRRAFRRRRTMQVAGVLAATTGLALGGVLAGGLVPERGSGQRDRTAAVGPPPAAAPTRTKPAAAVTLELAAEYAAAQPFTPPRPDQWTYVEVRAVNRGAIAESKGQNPDETRKQWARVDGTKMAGINTETGKLDVWDQDGQYRKLAALPTEPRALLNRMLESAGEGPFKLKTEEQRNAFLFQGIAGTLRENVLPPAVKATLLRAVALIPGVTRSPEKVDVHGRSATAVGRVVEGWRYEEILLDADTHAFIGQRAVAVKNFDQAYDDGGTRRTVHVKKGEVQYVLTQVAHAIVDAPGETG